MPPSSRHKTNRGTKPPRPVAKRGKMTGTKNIKKEKTKYHKEKFARERDVSGVRKGVSVKRNDFEGDGGRRVKSARTKEIDLNLAAKVSSELRTDIGNFKSKLSNTDFFGPELNEVLAFVPPSFVQQHLPDEVRSFRSYMSKFERGAPNIVHAFLAWYEWASYEQNKGKHSRKSARPTDRHAEAGVDEAKQDENEEAVERPNENAPEGTAAPRKFSQTRASLAKTVREREHARALLQMCLRHNSARRREGQHALINHLKARIADGVDCHSLQTLRDTAHHAVSYTLARLLLGMVTDDLAMIVLHAQALFLTLRETAVTSTVVLSLIAEEFAFDMRLKAVRARLLASAPDTMDEIDPDEINDPTRGERNQRMVAALFAMIAVVANPSKVLPDDARRLSEYLCFTYIEQRATRVLSANALFLLLSRVPSLWSDAVVMEWLVFAFFQHPRLEYYRPEGVQLLLRLCSLDELPRGLPAPVLAAAAMDPLEPSHVERIANALFRREQVTAVHPMVHPVWDDWLGLVAQRCAAGESMKEHLSTMVHNAVAPYRRGNADAPRRALLQRVVARLGQLAVQHDDADTRAEMLHLASRTVGYGRQTMAKPTDIAELRALPVDALDAKVRDLIRQYRSTRDADPAAASTRTWVLRELRACLYVPLRAGVVCPYVDDAAAALLEFGFFPTQKTRDERNMNRAVYLFADVFSFTYEGSLARPKCSRSPLRLIETYLAAEEKGHTRYTTGRTQSVFRRARNRIVEALEASEKRSVLFYAERDMEILLTLLFIVLSTDDPTNEDAKLLAGSTAPDLCQFYLHGTLETIDIFYDVLMALVMRPTSPIHVMPLMSCVRRIATGYMLKFARFVRERVTLDLLLAPLREAFHTDDRELARQAKARGGKTANDSGSDDDEASAAAAAEEEEQEEEEEEEEQEEEKDGDDEKNAIDAVDGGKEDDASSNSGSDSSSSSSSSSSSDDDDDDNDDNDEEDAETATAVDSNEAEEAADDDDDDDDENENEDDEEKADEDIDMLEDDSDDDNDDEEPATQQYIDALKGMVGNADLQFVYPTNTASKEKSDVVRAITTVTRVGCAMRSPLMVHIFQVLLAVCRENVKTSDDVIFNVAVSSLELLTMTKNRYFGRFIAPEDLFQLLADIQSFCRKLEHVLVRRESQSARHAVVVRQRMSRLKDVSLRVFHFVAYIAHKNHAGEEVRVTLAEYYKSVFADRGWDDKRRLPGVKRDMHHYRHGFAWALVPAALEKFADVAGIAGPQRVRVFRSCCRAAEALLPRLSGVGAALRAAAGAAIAAFLRAAALRELYDMKQTLLYEYFHCLLMVLRYNARVGIDTAWLSAVVAEAVDDDALQMSAATIRLIGSIERLLGVTPRARETKAPVPLKLLYSQHEKMGRREKAAFYRKAKRVRVKIVKALLAHRNDDPTDAERAAKRRRREELRIDDRVQRQVLRESRSAALTKEEREEKRKRIMVAKQERIAKNRERKRRLHEHRERAFQRWREQKLATAAHQEV